MIVRFIVMFCLVLNIRPAISNDVLTLKSNVQNLKNLNLYMNNTGKPETDEQKQLRISFYNTVHKICIDSSKQKVQQTHPMNKETLDMLENVCDCYTLTLMDKVDWVKLKQMKNEQIDAYLATFDTEVREQCKTELADRYSYNNKAAKPAKNHIEDQANELAGKVFAGVIFAIIFSILAWLVNKGLKNSKKDC